MPRVSSECVSTEELPAKPGCFLCGRLTYDPDKRSTPWVRGVAGGRQVLVCPECQRDVPGWPDRLDRCENCGSTRLSAMLGQIVCRACGHTAGTSDVPSL
jgi:predicted amidophosphoribosyltransferase